MDGIFAALGCRLPAAEAAQIVEDLVEAFAVDELHGVIMNAVALAYPEDRHNVRVVQSSSGFRLALKALQIRGVGAAVAGKHLERHVPAQRDLLGLVHHAHAAPADLADQPIARDSFRAL